MIALSTDKPRPVPRVLPALQGRTPADYLLCNCAGCGREILGESERGFYRLLTPEQKALFPPPVEGRVLERPYCPECLASSSRSTAVAPGWGIPKKRQRRAVPVVPAHAQEGNR